MKRLTYQEALVEAIAEEMRRDEPDMEKIDKLIDDIAERQKAMQKSILKKVIKQRKLLAICALEKIRAVDSIDTLETLARDDNDLVKSRARRALDALDRVESKRPTDE